MENSGMNWANASELSLRPPKLCIRTFKYIPFVGMIGEFLLLTVKFITTPACDLLSASETLSYDFISGLVTIYLPILSLLSNLYNCSDGPTLNITPDLSLRHRNAGVN